MINRDFRPRLSLIDAIARGIVELFESGLSWSDAVLYTGLNHRTADEDVLASAESRANRLLELRA